MQQRGTLQQLVLGSKAAGVPYHELLYHALHGMRQRAGVQCQDPHPHPRIACLVAARKPCHGCPPATHTALASPHMLCAEPVAVRSG